MSVNLKVTLGTVNYTDYLHITASKVSNPSVIVWEDYIDVPVTNYNFVIPGLDPENYYIRYRDAASIGDLGSLVAELVVNALTSEFVHERRFYSVGSAGMPEDGDEAITDSYLIGKNVTGVFKETFRYYEPETEYTFDSVSGVISLLNGNALSYGEKIIVEITYAVAASPSTSGGGSGLYSGILTVTDQTFQLLQEHSNNLIRLEGVVSTQVITLPPLSAMSSDNGFYFDNTVNGVAVQPKILTSGIDKILFNGFFLPTNLLSEIWVSRGEHLLLKKFGDYWEVRGDYNTSVGEKVTLGFNNHPNTLIENGALIDGDEYPRLWWWLKNVCPTGHYFTTDTVLNDSSFNSYFGRVGRIGQFAIHSTLKKFRMPNTQNLSERGLKSFTDFGGDVLNRLIDYPGGYQEQMLLKHSHPLKYGRSGGVNTDAANGMADVGQNPVIRDGYVQDEGGTEQRVKNIGVIYARRI